MNFKKNLSRKKISSCVQFYKKRKKKIVFTNGTFDILHLGHISYLQKAKKMGDILIVGVNSDRSVKSYKNPNRPINSEKDRIKVLTALGCVDHAVIFNESTPINLIREIMPNVLVKGADWKIKDIVGAKEVISLGGKVKRISFLKGYSSTRIIKALNLE